MVGYGGSSAGSYLANLTSPIPSHCASNVATSTLRVKPNGLTAHFLQWMLFQVLFVQSFQVYYNVLEA